MKRATDLEATIQRGELKLLGKIFKLNKNSAIRFTGPMPPDPELDIRAKLEPVTTLGLGPNSAWSTDVAWVP